MPRKKLGKTRKRQRGIEDTGFGFGIPSTRIPTLDMPTIKPAPIPDLTFPEQEKIDPNKIPKIRLIGILSKKLSVDEIYKSLVRLGKDKLANTFMNGVKSVNEKYDKMLMGVDGKVEENFEDKLLGAVVDEIISPMRGLYSLSFKPKNEIEFHKQIEPFLTGVISTMKTSLARLGSECHIEREYSLPSNERIDLMILIGVMKIGIEVKYNLEETSQLQRLLGQIDRYIPYMDLLIVVSYNSLDTNTINAIKNKEIEKGKPIRIVTPDKVI